MEKGSCQNRISTAFGKSIIEMCHIACTTGCNNRNIDAVGNSACKFKVITLLLTVAIANRLSSEYEAAEEEDSDE